MACYNKLGLKFCHGHLKFSESLSPIYNVGDIFSLNVLQSRKVLRRATQKPVVEDIGERSLEKLVVCRHSWEVLVMEPKSNIWWRNTCFAPLLLSPSPSKRSNIGGLLEVPHHFLDAILHQIPLKCTRLEFVFDCNCQITDN